MWLVWAQGYVAKSKFAGELSAGTIEVVMLGADSAQVRAIENISARGVSVSMDNQEFLRGADFSTDLNATWKAGTLTADIKQLELRQGTLSVLKASVSGDVTPPAAGKTLRAVGRGQLDADFSVLAKQPALAAQLPLLRGTVAVKFDGTYADGAKGKVTIAAKDLVAREGALALGSMDLSVDAALDANNSGTVRNALVVTKEGRRSDILLDGKVGMKPGAISFEGRITGDQLIVDDLQAFSALGAPPPPTAASLAKSPALAPAPAPRPATTTAPRPAATAAAKPAGPVKDTTPIWAGFTGRVDVNVKTIKQGTANTITSVLGVFSVREDRLAAESLSFQLNGNSFKAATILSFDVKQARPYALVGTFDVPKFDVGAYLHKADPNVAPALETTITIASKFNGTAANLEEFADRVVGQFELKGSKGVLRALNKKAEQSSMALGLGGLAAGLLGQQKIADGLVGAAELAALLKDIQFDGITVQADRGADGVATVRKIEIIAPTLRLTGSGHIEAKKPGGEFGDCPLSFELQLAGKDRLAEGLNKARQLSGKTDEKGYYLMATPFTLGGTVSKPDSSSFWKNLTLNTGAGFLR
ncbi:MAG: hypothetical protein NTV51_16880 [Verrucomicrobia bacterium]|nr:hypothetical protein [Verrucomicrobiota bacterium]